MSEPFQTDRLTRLRQRLAVHGYHLFLKPDRPDGWWIVLHPREGGAPTELRASTRDEALSMAEGLFARRIVADLDQRVRAHGLVPPAWTGTLDEQVERLSAFSDEHDLHA
jgi:hypothetical protein